MGKKGKGPGKKAKGRAGQREKAHKGTPRAVGWAENFVRSSNMLDDAGEDSYKLFKGFNQGAPSSSFSPRSNVKLRHQAISFVAAGSEGEQVEVSVEDTAVEVPRDSDDDEDEEEDDDDVDDSAIQTNIVMDTDLEISEGTAQMHINSSGGMTDHDTADTSNHISHQDPLAAWNNATTRLPQEYVAEAAAAERKARDPVAPHHAPQSVARETFKQTAVEPMAVDKNLANGEPLFVVDTEGDANLKWTSKANGKRKEPRAPSPAASDSSEEVIVFHGRNKQTQTSASRSAPKPTPTSSAFNAPSAATSSAPRETQAHPKPAPQPHITDGLLAALEAPSAASSSWASSSSSPAKGWGAKQSKFDQKSAEPWQTKSNQQTSSDAWQPAPSKAYWKAGKARPDLDPSPAEKMALDSSPARKTKVMFAEPADQGEEEEGASQTIASLQADWNAHLKAKKLAKGPSSSLDGTIELDSGSKSNRRGKRGRRKDNRQLRAAINGDDDEADEAAYEDYMENLAAQLDEEGEADTNVSINSDPLAAVSNPMGGPSLVVHGTSIGDEEVLHEKLVLRQSEDSDDSSESDGPIGQDFSDLSDEGPLNLSDLDSSDLEDELEYTEREQWEDEEDLRQRRLDAMTDEQIARLLAKQEELGIDGDDLVIDDGMYIDDEDDIEGIGDLDEARAGLTQITNSTFGRSRNKHGMRTRRGNGGFSFPDASALADSVEQYGENGFDIMDFERPSIRKGNKGKKSKLPPELDSLSDDDLKDQLLGSWENDREKKRLKKAEREELRAQGLLGATGRKGKADLSQKYLQGMTMPQVLEELKGFLQNDGQTSRPFPPMDKRNRKALHEVANALNLKSKSVGTGNSRFPVLYKTTFTVEYSEVMFRRIQKASERGFLKNSSFKAPKAGKAPKPMRAGRGGGFSSAAVGLRNGEIVGAGAAEIGKESFGHKLMEKMGWSKGMALGKEGEGRLVPVEQVMRQGKAGLG